MGLLNIRLNLNFNTYKEPNLALIHSELLLFYQEILNSTATYNVTHSGRGAAKNSQHADILLLDSFNKELTNTNFLCFREFQNSIDTSVHSLLEARIRYFDLVDYFSITNKKIINKANNVTFFFKGMQSPASIKSIFNISRGWGEECEQMTTEKLEVVIPSLRRLDGGPVKLYFTYNPFKVVDDVLAYARRQSSKLIKTLNIQDLPSNYQNKVLLDEMAADKKYNPEYYKWKWLGEPYPNRVIEPFINLSIITKYTAQGRVYAFLDPSFKGVDTTTLTIAWVSGAEKVTVYGRVFHLAWNECVTDIVETCKRFNATNLFYEDNSLGLVPKDIFRGYGDILPHTSKGNKVDRIFKVAPILQHLEFIEDDLSYSYIKQIKEYNAEKSTKNREGYYDDAPDSLASCLLVMKVIR